MRDDIFYNAQQRDVVLALQKRLEKRERHRDSRKRHYYFRRRVDMIQDKLRDNKIALKYNTYDNTCKIYSDKTLNLKSFGLLLGFSSSYTVLPKVWKTSSNAVDVNLGLRHVTLNCESINSAKNFDRQGRRSHTLFTFPVLPNQNLSSAVTYFSNIGSTTPMNNGLFSSLTFTIGSNIDDDVGVIIYFEVIIKE